MTKIEGRGGQNHLKGGGAAGLKAEETALVGGVMVSLITRILRNAYNRKVRKIMS